MNLVSSIVRPSRWPARPLAGVGLLALALAACQQQAQPAFERPPAPVAVAAAIARDTPLYIDAVGKAVANEIGLRPAADLGAHRQDPLRGRRRSQAGRPPVLHRPAPGPGDRPAGRGQRGARPGAGAPGRGQHGPRPGGGLAGAGGAHPGPGAARPGRGQRRAQTRPSSRTPRPRISATRSWSGRGTSPASRATRSGPRWRRRRRRSAPTRRWSRTARPPSRRPRPASRRRGPRWWRARPPWRTPARPSAPTRRWWTARACSSPTRRSGRPSTGARGSGWSTSATSSPRTRARSSASSGSIPIYAEFTVTENDLTEVQRHMRDGRAHGRGPAARPSRTP